ncbi:alpha/beta fold hydrolase [Nonomuraea thailandensis]
MPIPYLRRALTIVISVALLLCGSAAAQAESAAGRTPKPTVVLVHGAFADASGFNDTIALLQAAGFPTIAPANPLRDAAGDAAYISSVLDTITGPVILVGHSYGGIVITNAARGHTNVKALVYLGAFAPDQGERAPARHQRAGQPARRGAHHAPLPAAGRHDPARRQRPGRRLHRPCQVPAGVRRRPARLPDPADGHHPAPGQRRRTRRAQRRPGLEDHPVLVSHPDPGQGHPPDVQRMMAKRAGSHVREIRSSHVVMMSHPAASAATILAAYAGTR